jgi:hypothetical protein
MDCLGAVLFGVHVNSTADKDNEFVRHARNVFKRPKSWKVGIACECFFTEFIDYFSFLSSVLFPSLLHFLKKLGIEVSVFGEKKDIMFIVDHVEHIIKMRRENKDVSENFCFKKRCFNSKNKFKKRIELY